MSRWHRRSGPVVLSSFRPGIPTAQSRSRFPSGPRHRPEWRKPQKSPKHERQTLFSIYHAPRTREPASDKSGQALVQRPDWNRREQGSGQQVRIDPADALAEQPLGFYRMQHQVIRRLRNSRQMIE